MSAEIIVGLIALGAAVTTGIVAVIRLLVTHTQKLQSAAIENQLKYVEKQIDELYGPLYVLSAATEYTFVLLILTSVCPNSDPKELLKKVKEKKVNPYKYVDWVVKKYGPQNTEEGQVSQWRIWIETVLAPWRIKLRELVLNKAHLLVDDKIKDCLVEIVAYASEWEGIVKKWEMGDFNQERSQLFKYPKKLRKYAERNYNKLKEKQLKLLGCMERRNILNILKGFFKKNINKKRRKHEKTRHRPAGSIRSGKRSAVESPGQR